MEDNDIIVQKVQTVYGYEVASSLMDLEEYDMEGEIPTRIMSLEANTNTKDTYQIGLDMIYQAEIANFIKRSIAFQQNLRKSYTVVWEF